MLTVNQRQVLNFISEYQRDTGGVSPSLREIATATGRNSGAAHHLLDSLEKRGFIRRLKGEERAIEILPRVVHKLFKFNEETKQLEYLRLYRA